MSIFGALGGGGGGSMGDLMAAMSARMNPTAPQQAPPQGTQQAPPGGLLGFLQQQQQHPGTPYVPSDGAMGPTIGPGMPAPAPAAPAYTPRLGLPKGGLLGILQGQSPQGIMGLLQSMRSQGSPLAGGMPAAGMLSGLPGTPGAAAYGPAAPPPPQLPMDINPMNQF